MQSKKRLLLPAGLAICVWFAGFSFYRSSFAGKPVSTDHDSREAKMGYLRHLGSGKPSIGVDDTGAPPKSATNAYSFYEKVSKLESTMSLKEVDKVLEIKHKEVSEKIPYINRTEADPNTNVSKVQPMAQYRWDDPKSISYVVIEFDEHGMTSIMNRSFVESVASLQVFHD